MCSLLAYVGRNIDWNKRVFIYETYLTTYSLNIYCEEPCIFKTGI